MLHGAISNDDFFIIIFFFGGSHIVIRGQFNKTFTSVASVLESENNS